MDTNTARMRIGGHRSGARSRYAKVSREDLSRLKRARYSLHPTGYATRSDWIDGKRVTVYLHREVMGLKYGDNRVVDHKNGNQLDCTRENLRVLAEPGLNAQNVRTSGGSSKFRGVSAAGGKWRARVTHKGQRHYLGTFERELDAAVAAELKRQQLMPYAEPDPELAKAMGDKVKLLLPRDLVLPVAA